MLNVGLLVWLWNTPNVPNYLDDSHISTLCHGNRMDIYPLPPSSMKSSTPPSSFSSESILTSNQMYKRNRKRNIKKQKSPTSSSHIGDVPLIFESHAGGDSIHWKSYWQ
jgi:hypothetical protein